MKMHLIELDDGSSILIVQVYDEVFVERVPLEELV